MSGAAVLLCSGAGLPADSIDCAPAVVVSGLCDRPADAAAALRGLGASRAVLALCDRSASTELTSALVRAGVSPFGISSVVVHDRPAAEAKLLIEAAAARLAALDPGDGGKPVLSASRMSRRALLQVAPAVEQAPVAIVDRSACVGTTRCGLCAGACPELAIDPSGSSPVVKTALCTACGSCVPSCPHGAIHLTGSSPAQIEAQLESLLSWVEGVILACSSRSDVISPSGWAVVELAGLGLVSPGWLLQLRARGVEVRLAPCTETCCAGVGEIEAFAERLLSAVETPRGVLPERVHLSEPLATVDAVSYLYPTATVVIEDAASPLGVVSIAPERCTLCGACDTACPTRSLQLCEEVRETILRHEPSACVGCGRCVAACPEDALTVTRAIDSARLGAGTIELARAARETCTECNAELPPLPLRRRLRELLPALADTPPGLCATCAARHPAYDRSTVPSTTRS